MDGSIARKAKNPMFGVTMDEENVQPLILKMMASV